MPTKINPTAGQKRIFMIHVVVFAIANIIMWYVRNHMMAVEHRWVYPLPAWITAAWALAVVGHACALWTTYEDPGMHEYMRQRENG